MTEQEKRKAREAEDITHFPFPNLHLFIVTPNGTPVGELRFNRVEPDDARLDLAALDVDRLTARMGHMTRAQLTDMDNQLAGIRGRLREFMSQPHPENGNGTHEEGKPTTPPEEPIAQAHRTGPDEMCFRGYRCPLPLGERCQGELCPVESGTAVPASEAPQAVVAAPSPAITVTPPAAQAVTPEAPPARTRRPRGTGRRSARERLAAAGSAATATASQASREGTPAAPVPLSNPPATPAPASAPAVPPPATAPAAAHPAPTSPPAASRSPSTPAPNAPTATTAPPSASQPNAPTSPHARARPPQPATQTPVATPAPTTSTASASALSGSAPTPAPSSSPAAAPATLDAKILASVASGPKSFGELSTGTGGTAPEIFTTVKRLLDAGKLRKDGSAYRLP